jgi:1-phosphatidylinositol-5-phosphate 4-kinase
VARQASEKERAKDLPKFKDNDFLNDGRLIRVGPECRDKLLKTIQADSEVAIVLFIFFTQNSHETPCDGVLYFA